MEKKIEDIREDLLVLAAKESNKDIQMGFLLSIYHIDNYQTDDYSPLSAICYQMYKKQEELCVS